MSWEYQEAGAAFLAGGGMLLADEPGLGKLHPVDTRVMTPHGWREIGELCEGEMVTGSDGRPTRVVGIYPQGVKAIYRVIFSDGSSVEAGAEHLWAVERNVGTTTGGRTIRRVREVLTTAQIAAHPYLERRRDGRRRGGLYLPMLSGPVRFTRDILPLPAYFVGQLIANGGLAHGACVLVINAADEEHVVKRLADWFDPPKWRRSQYTPTVVRLSYRGMLGKLRDLGMDVKSTVKRIPMIYQRADPVDRIALLQGLMDGDGSVSKQRNRVTYHTTSAGLAQDVQTLVEALGGIASIRSYDRSHQDKPTEYQVRMRLPEWAPPFSSPRKAEKYGPGRNTAPCRTVVSVEYAREAEAVCIAVDAPDALYTIDHCILTHNTRQALLAAGQMGARTVLVLCPAIAVGVWQSEVAKWRPDLTAVPVAQARKAGKVPRTDRVLISSYDMAIRRDVAAKLAALDHDLLVCDECFPAGTLVSTPSGPVPIDALGVGDVVLGYDHDTGRVAATRVKHTFKRPAGAPLVTVAGIAMTWNHPVWTRERGYVMACTVRDFETVGYTDGKDVRMVRADVLASETKHHETAPVLLEEVQYASPVGGGGIRSRCGAHQVPGEHVDAGSSGQASCLPQLGSEPVPQAGSSGQVTAGAAQTRLGTSERGQRQADTGTPTIGFGGPGMAYRVCGGSAGNDRWPPFSLQDRRGRARLEGSGGNRRGRTQSETSTGRRSAQDRVFDGAGLDGVAVHQSGSTDQLAPGAEHRHVFNLETGTGNYFAGGLLVHNCHALKNPVGTKRTILVYGAGCSGRGGLIERCGATRLLTGTPQLNGCHELFPHIRALAPHRIEQSSYQAFVNHYCIRGVRTMRYRDKATGEWREMDREVIEGTNRARAPELAHRLRGFWLRRTVEQVLGDLPPLRVVQRTLPVDLLDSRKLAEAEDSDEVVELRRALKTGDPEALRGLEGHLSRLRRLVADVKVPATVAWAEGALDAGEPKVAIWGWHVAALRAIRDALAKHDPVMITGETSTRDALVARFNDDPKCRVGVFQIQAAGTALTMTACRRVLMHEQAWTPALNEQAVKRHHRISQTMPVLAEVLAAPGVDELVQDVLARKLGDIQAVEGE